jgi:hypothetical protein
LSAYKVVLKVVMEPETTAKEIRCCCIVCATTLRKAEEGGVVESEYWLRPRPWSQISWSKNGVC